MFYKFLITIVAILLGFSISKPHLLASAFAKRSEDLPSVKLIFIHHSVGGHWLAHDNGALVSELNKNNYYINDVTYGWEPASLTDTFSKKLKRKILAKLGKANKGAYGIGNRTDIGHMPEWFIGPDSDLIMETLYGLNLETDNYGDHANSSSKKPLQNPDPSAENQIIMFKSCYSNTLLKGNPADQASQTPVYGFSANSDEHTVANAKRIFNDLLKYFESKTDKFFVIVTPPPRLELPEDGKIARGFSNWLVNDWLTENRYPLKNVMVFDLFNVLTSSHSDGANDADQEQGNHHRIWQSRVQHVVGTDSNRLVYPREQGNNHPSPAGLQKASKEFVPLLNHYFKAWQQSRLTVN
jgi:hypothetical protein